MNKEIKNRKDNKYTCKQESQIKIDLYLLTIVLQRRVCVSQMNKEIKDRKDNKYTCKQASQIKLDIAYFLLCCKEEFMFIID